MFSSFVQVTTPNQRWLMPAAVNSGRCGPECLLPLQWKPVCHSHAPSREVPTQWLTWEGKTIKSSHFSPTSTTLTGDFSSWAPCVVAEATTASQLSPQSRFPSCPRDLRWFWSQEHLLRHLLPAACLRATSQSSRPVTLTMDPLACLGRGHHPQYKARGLNPCELLIPHKEKLYSRTDGNPTHRRMALRKPSPPAGRHTSLVGSGSRPSSSYAWSCKGHRQCWEI